MKNYVNPLLPRAVFLKTIKNIVKHQNTIGFLMFSDGIEMQH